MLKVIKIGSFGISNIAEILMSLTKFLAVLKFNTVGEKVLLLIYRELSK